MVASSYSKLHTSNSAEGRSCQTKPNLGTLGYLGDETRDTGPNAPNKPNSGNPTYPPFHPDAGCTNKAKLGRAGVSGGRQGIEQGNSAKRSQFVKEFQVRGFKC